VKFEWDEAKERANLAKHGIDFRTAAKVFIDPLMLEFEDEDAYGEIRWSAIGMVEGRLLFVTYTERTGRFRLISARGAEPHEKRRYHEHD
jgi:uncharacterized DUF497 family protein